MTFSICNEFFPIYEDMINLLDYPKEEWEGIIQKTLEKKFYGLPNTQISRIQIENFLNKWLTKYTEMKYIVKSRYSSL